MKHGKDMVIIVFSPNGFQDGCFSSFLAVFPNSTLGIPWHPLAPSALSFQELHHSANLVQMALALEHEPDEVRRAKNLLIQLPVPFREVNMGNLVHFFMRQRRQKIQIF